MKICSTYMYIFGLTFGFSKAYTVRDLLKGLLVRAADLSIKWYSNTNMSAQCIILTLIL